MFICTFKTCMIFFYNFSFSNEDLKLNKSGLIFYNTYCMRDIKVSFPLTRMKFAMKRRKKRLYFYFFEQINVSRKSAKQQSLILQLKLQSLYIASFLRSSFTKQAGSKIYFPLFLFFPFDRCECLARHL